MNFLTNEEQEQILTYLDNKFDKKNIYHIIGFLEDIKLGLLEELHEGEEENDG